MSAPAALAGSYADFKLVKTRAVCQLIIELPIEQAEAAIKMFGIPMSGTEIPVAVALLVAEAKPADVSRSERGKEQYRAKDAMEQAAIRAVLLCKDLKFQLWASKQITPESNCRDATEWLRWKLGVKSRNEISTKDGVYLTFLRLEQQFKMDTGLAAEVR
jgi:hypothetical protein